MGMLDDFTEINNHMFKTCKDNNKCKGNSCLTCPNYESKKVNRNRNQNRVIFRYTFFIMQNRTIFVILKGHCLQTIGHLDSNPVLALFDCNIYLSNKKNKGGKKIWCK